MPRYHFNVEDGESLPDPEGTELPDLAAARREAVKLVGRLLEDNAAEFWVTGRWRVNVTDATGALLFRLTFSAEDGPPAPGARLRLVRG